MFFAGLERFEKLRFLLDLRNLSDAPVAQLDRASASGAEGHRFESYRVCGKSSKKHVFQLISANRFFRCVAEIP